MASQPETSSARAAQPEPADAELLESFVKNQDHAAFEMLVARHGTLVMGLLRRMGLQQADADDAFQATFLTLVRKADSISKRDSLGSWLYKVAYRIALELRERVKKRQAKEQPLSGSEQAAMAKNLAEFWELLDAEVVQLPEKYRVPFVMCELEGASLEQAAKEIGCPIGTVGTRLAKVREMLRSRLARRGLIVSAALLTAFLLQQPAQAAPTAALVAQTMQTAAAFQGAAAGIAVSAKVLALSNNAIVGMTMAKVKLAVLIAAAAAVLLTAVSSVAIFWPRDEAPSADWLALLGTVADPDADSKFTATKTSLDIRTPGPTHVLLDDARQNAPRVIHDVQGEFLVQVQVAAIGSEKAPTDFERGLIPAPNVLNVAAFRGGGIVIMQDENNFTKLQRGILHQGDGVKHYLLWQARIEGKPAFETVLVPEQTPFRYLRMQRLGPHVFASASPDGERWGSFPAVTYQLAEGLRTGLIVDHNTADGMEATFTDYKVTPFDYNNNPQPPWKGPPAPVGCAKCHAGPPPAPASGFQFRFFPVRKEERKE